ncbi:hypothetical protein M8J77_019248 [Diaphorina citri]|nr:hypothetical protein M8J77_019248 [Diaphorina citri]
MPIFVKISTKVLQDDDIAKVDIEVKDRGKSSRRCTASPWPPTLSLSGTVDLDPVTAAAAWGRKLYPPPGHRMFGLHHHQDASAGLHHHHHHHQPRGPVTTLKEEPLSSSQLAAARSWMQPSVVDQSR